LPLFRGALSYSLLTISCIAWAALPIIPFLPFDGEQLVAWGAGVFIFAEITWWLAIPLLGKEILDLWQRYRGEIKALFSKQQD
jgi:hypothetical protein